MAFMNEAFNEAISDLTRELVLTGKLDYDIKELIREGTFDETIAYHLHSIMDEEYKRCLKLRTENESDVRNSFYRGCVHMFDVVMNKLLQKEIDNDDY